MPKDYNTILVLLIILDTADGFGCDLDHLTNTLGGIGGDCLCFVEVDAQSQFFLALSGGFGLLSHGFQVPAAVVVVGIAVVAVVPVALFEQGTTGGFLHLLSLLFGNLLVRTFLFPFLESLLVDRSKSTAELVAFRVEEVFEGESVEGRFVHESLFGGALFFCLEDEAGEGED